MKKFVLTFTVGDDGMLRSTGENTGFTALELLGMLETKKTDIIDQMMHHELFKRYVVDSDGVRKEIVKEGEDEKSQI